MRKCWFFGIGTQIDVVKVNLNFQLTKKYNIMTLVKFNPFFPAVAKDLDSAVNEFFNRPIGSVFKDEIPFNTPAINVHETEKGYFISLAAPGLEKGDFKVDLEQGILNISVDKEMKELEEGTKVTRKEFSFFKFKHSFTLPEDVDTSKINAEYVNGILEVNLPRKAAKLLKTKNIQVK